MVNNNKIFELIETASTRPPQLTKRQMIKAFEEVGELSEAYLGASTTKKQNYKNKKWNDVVEEAIDVFLLITDILLIPYPNVPDYEKLIKEHMFVNKLTTVEFSYNICDYDNIDDNIGKLVYSLGIANMHLMAEEYQIFKHYLYEAYIIINNIMLVNYQYTDHQIENIEKTMIKMIETKVSKWMKIRGEK